MVDRDSRQVVYLFGAGASHGCAKAVGSEHGILMGDLSVGLSKEARNLVTKPKYQSHKELQDLVNAVVTEDMDYEHLITFLDQSPSAIHREFAEDLRNIFERILRDRLDTIDEELGQTPTDLYEALIDLHDHPDFTEELSGVLTLNYDEYIERAIESLPEHRVDFGINVQGTPTEGTSIQLLKLHGSFGWTDRWPISTGDGDPALWIPPGIQKAKDRYPFNILWGRARELLDCDVLRIIGCGLSPNDWDLVSLLFSTQLSNAQGRTYSVEVIDSPLSAQRLSNDFPYLDILSILELEHIGRSLIAEYIGGKPRSYESLTPDEQETALEAAGKGRNWFRIWLIQMAEAVYREYGSVETSAGRLEALLEAS